MSKPNAELKRLLALARTYGVKRLKYGNIEVEFDNLAGEPRPETKPTQSLPAIPGIPTEGPPSITEDELLYWSCGYDPAENRDQPAGIGAIAEN